MIDTVRTVNYLYSSAAGLIVNKIQHACTCIRHCHADGSIIAERIISDCFLYVVVHDKGSAAVKVAPLLESLRQTLTARHVGQQPQIQLLVHCHDEGVPLGRVRHKGLPHLLASEAVRCFGTFQRVAAIIDATGDN